MENENKEIEEFEDMWCGEDISTYHLICGYNNGDCSTCNYSGGCNI